MQLTLTVPEEIVREAQERGLPVIDFVETLIAKGLAAVLGRRSLDSAVERIRALRSPARERDK